MFNRNSNPNIERLTLDGSLVEVRKYRDPKCAGAWVVTTGLSQTQAFRSEPRAYEYMDSEVRRLIGLGWKITYNRVV